MCLQPVMIPVGKIALDRIFKATGTVIDDHASLIPTDVHSNTRSIMLLTDKYIQYSLINRTVYSNSLTMSVQGNV